MHFHRTLKILQAKSSPLSCLYRVLNIRNSVEKLELRDLREQMDLKPSTLSRQELYYSFILSFLRHFIDSMGRGGK